MKTVLIGAGIGAAIGVVYALSRRSPSSSALVTPLPASPTTPKPGGGIIVPTVPPPSGPTQPAAQPPSAEGEAFFDALSKNPVTRSGQLFEAVRERVPELVLAPVELSDSKGNTGTVWVTADAIKLYGVRINLDTYYLQQLADHFSGMMMTQKVADEIWKQAKFRPTPSSRDITASTEGMIGHSADVDKKLAGLGYKQDSDTEALVANSGKDWLLNSWYWLPGKNNLHCRDAGMSGAVPNAQSGVNYGWFATNNGGGLYKPSGSGLYVIQQAGQCHDWHHVDYSQVARLIAGIMRVNDQYLYVADVITSPEFAGLLSYEGPLPGARHPNVPLIQGSSGGGILV